jgi:hypothetical protein
MAMSDQVKKMIELGYTKADATSRARVMESANSANGSLANGLCNGDHVMVDFCGRTAEAIVIDNQITVGGCSPAAGMVTAILSKPWRLNGGDWNLSATLADGTVLTAHSPHGNRVWRDVNGTDVDFAAAVMAIPA